MMCLWGWGQGGAVESSSPSPQLHIDLTEAGSLGDSLLLGRLKATLTPHPAPPPSIEHSVRNLSNIDLSTSQWPHNDLAQPPASSIATSQRGKQHKSDSGRQ